MAGRTRGGNQQNGLTAQYGLEDLLMLACFGNHEISWDAPDANYLASSPVYWQNIMAHIQKFVDSGAATLGKKPLRQYQQDKQEL